MQIRISFRSRSDLALDAERALDFLSYLVLQACISFCSTLTTRTPLIKGVAAHPLN